MGEEQASAKDFEDIAAWFNGSSGDVAKAGAHLKQARAGLIATDFGMKFAADLDAVVYESLGLAPSDRNWSESPPHGNAPRRKRKIFSPRLKHSTSIWPESTRRFDRDAKRWSAGGVQDNRAFGGAPGRAPADALDPRAVADRGRAEFL